MCITVVGIAVLEDQPNISDDLVDVRIRKTWLYAPLTQATVDRTKIHRFLDNVEVVGDIVGHRVNRVAKWLCFACFKQARQDVFDVLLLVFGNTDWRARSVLRGLPHSGSGRRRIYWDFRYTSCRSRGLEWGARARGSKKGDGMRR